MIFDNLLSIYYSQPITFYTFFIILSLCVGSFLNVVISRLPKMLERQWQIECKEFLNLTDKTATKSKIGIIFPRSFCPACKSRITWFQNVPLISYVFLKGRCAYCKNRIAYRYPIVEALTAVLSLCTLQYFGLSIQTLYSLILIYFLITLTFIDLETQLLPDNLTQPLIWLGLLINIQQVFVSLEYAVIGTVVAYLFLWLVLKLFYLATKKEGMGLGDLKLFAALGAWFGWKSLPFILLIASLIGLIVGLLLIFFKGHDKQTPFAFGPYLSIAGTIYLFYGPVIIDYYFNHLFHLSTG